MLRKTFQLSLTICNFLLTENKRLNKLQNDSRDFLDINQTWPKSIWDKLRINNINRLVFLWNHSCLKKKKVEQSFALERLKFSYFFQASNMWSTMSVNKEIVPWVRVWALMALKPVQTGKFWHFSSTLGVLKTSFSFYITKLYFVTKIPEWDVLHAYSSLSEVSVVYSLFLKVPSPHN